jgi:hypothetical protein
MYLLGEQNKDQRLLDVFNEILLVRETGKSFEQMMGGFGKGMGDGLWYGVGGAVIIARWLMLHGADACLPNSWCEIASK